MIERLQRLAKINGRQVVSDKAKEECQELIDAIESNIEEDIIDETADVLVMAFQLMFSHDIEKEVYERIDFKLDRIEKKMGIGKGEQ